MNRNKLMRRLSVVAALVAVLAVAAGTPVLQAQPEAGTISTGAGVQVWNGHNCPANVPVNISGLSAGLGGYETKIAWPAGRFDNTPANVVVTLSNYLTNGGTRTSSSTPPGTTPLKAVSGDTVKFGDYSWGAGNPSGNMTDGQLATVALKPTAACGSAQLIMSETQLVDISGNLIGTGQNPRSVNVLGRYNVDGDAIPVVMPFDVLAVVGKVGQPTSNSCGTGYQYNVDGDAIPVVMPFDVLAVVAKVGQTTCQ